jgi:hypothetical protein
MFAAGREEFVFSRPARGSGAGGAVSGEVSGSLSLSLPLALAAGDDAAAAAPRRGRRDRKRWKYGTWVPQLVRDFARRYPKERPLRIWQRTHQAIAELRTVVEDIGYRPAPGSGALRSIQKWVADARRTVPDGVEAVEAVETDGRPASRGRGVAVDVATPPVRPAWEPGTGQLPPGQERHVWEAIASVGWDAVGGGGAQFDGWMAWGRPIRDAQLFWPDVGEARWAAYLGEVVPEMSAAERVRWATWLSAFDTALPLLQRTIWWGLARAIRAARARRPPEYVPQPGSLTAGPAAGGCPAIPSREREVDRNPGEGATDG